MQLLRLGRAGSNPALRCGFTHCLRKGNRVDVLKTHLYERSICACRAGGGTRVFGQKYLYPAMKSGPCPGADTGLSPPKPEEQSFRFGREVLKPQAAGISQAAAARLRHDIFVSQDQGGKDCEKNNYQ
ncbi:MAG: hypothetical protein HFG25_02140 [Lachnospiraceae bacterium]|nr:hypothetical protein [Lachnospiraceae bacterium]